MRRFTLVLSLLLCCTTAALAQWTGKRVASVSTTATTSLTEGYYVLYNNGRGTFMNAEAEGVASIKVAWPTSASYTGVEALNSDEALNNTAGSKKKTSYVMYIKPSADGTTASIQNGFGKYVPEPVHNSGMNFTDTETSLVVEAGDGHFKFRNAANTVGVDCNGWSASSHTYSNVAGWDKGNGENQQWVLYAVTLEDATEVSFTYNYTINGVSVKTESVIGNVGDPLPAINVPNYINATIAGGAANITADMEGQTIEVDCSNYQSAFQLTPGSAYGFYLPRATYAYLTTNTDNAQGQTLTATAIGLTNYDLVDKYTWIIGGDWFNGFTLQNKDNSKYLTITSEDVVMQADVTDGSKYEIVWNNGNYYFKQKGTANNYLSNTGGFAGTDKALSTWDSGYNIEDAGSMFKPIDLNEDAMVAAWKAPMLAKIGYVGSYPTEKAAALEACTTAAQCAAFINSNSVIELADGYYRMYNVYRDGKNPTVQDYSGTLDLMGGAPDNKHVGQIIKVTKNSDGTFSLYSPNAKKYLANNNDRLVADAVNYTLEAKGDAQFSFKNGGSYLVLYANGYLGGWGSASKDGDGAWFVKEATDIEVALTEVGEASYASIYFPFAVSGNDLYAGQFNAANDALVMSQATGAVAAETGLIVKNDAKAATITLQIEASGNAVENNALRGVLVNTDLSSLSGLVFGINANDYSKVGFFGSATDATVLPANKAYLPWTGSSAVALDFEGSTTGIGAVANDNLNNGTVFDLSGRRVNGTVKGGLYIQNGKKFIVK